MSVTKQLKNYYQQISSLIPSKMRPALMSELQENIEHYLDANPDASFEDILQHFGTPEEIAGSCMESLNKDEYEKELNTKAKKKKFRITLVIIILAAIAGLYLFNYLYERSITPVYYTETIEEVPNE